MEKKFWIILCSTIFIVLMYLLLKNQITAFDNSIYNFFGSFINVQNTGIMVVITSFGNWQILVAVTILLITLRDQRKYYPYKIILVLTLVSAFILDCVLKGLFQRARPDFLTLIIENGYSFPSAHALVSLCFYGFIIYYISKTFENKWKYVINTFLVILIIAIGISRIYLGVHYPSDVLAGYCIGFLWLTFMIELLKKFIKNNHHHLNKDHL